MNAKDMFYPKDKQFTKAEKRLFKRQELVYNVTEDILVALEDMGLTKKQLASRLGKSPSFVTQILSGARNMTLGTLSDICFAIDAKPIINIGVHPKIDTLAPTWISEPLKHIAKNHKAKKPSELTLITNRKAPVPWVIEIDAAA